MRKFNTVLIKNECNFHVIRFFRKIGRNTRKGEMFMWETVCLIILVFRLETSGMYVISIFVRLEKEISSHADMTNIVLNHFHLVSTG